MVLALAATAYALAQTAVVPAMTGMAKALHASSASVTWVLTGYLVAAVTPVLGRLGDLFGKRRMLLIALLLFGAGAVMAAVVGNIWLVVVARVLQGPAAASSRSALASSAMTSRRTAGRVRSG